MKCFQHADIDAVGTCKQCNKGVCRSCSTDLGHGLACKDTHEADVEFLETLINRSKQSIAIQPRSTIAGNLSWLLMGIIFAGFGFYQANSFLMIFGGFCASYWIFLAVYNSAVFKKLDHKPAE